LSYYTKLLVVGLLLGSFVGTIDDGVVHAFNSAGKIRLLIVDFLKVFLCSSSLLVLFLRV
jgi:hypothetical protein